MLNIASWPVSGILCLYLIIDTRILEMKTKIKTAMPTGHKTQHDIVSNTIT